MRLPTVVGPDGRGRSRRFHRSRQSRRSAMPPSPKLIFGETGPFGPEGVSVQKGVFGPKGPFGPGGEFGDRRKESWREDRRSRGNVQGWVR